MPLRNCFVIFFRSNDYYYHIDYSEKHDEIIQFRVDRIVNSEILEEPSIPAPEVFDASEC